MDRVFVDTDILIDVLDQREPFYQSASQLFSKADRQEIKILLSALTFTTVHYILRKKVTSSESRKILAKVRALCQVIPVGDKVISLALVSKFSDFEDAVQYHSALESKATVIVTRNLKDYKWAEIPVMSPDGYLRTI